MESKMYFNIRQSANRIKPVYLMLYGISFFLIMWMIAPVEIADTLTVDSVGYIICCIFSCILGCMTLHKRKRKTTIIYESVKMKKIYNTTLLLSIIGVCVRLYDLIIMRGMRLGMDSFEDNIDMGLQQQNTSWLSIISALLYFVPFIPVTLNMIFPNLTSKSSKIFSFILFGFIGVGALISGSRNAFMDPLLLLGFLYIFTRNTITVKLKNMVIISILCGLFLMTSSFLFIQRLNLQSKTVFESVKSTTGGYSNKVPIKASYLQLMRKNSKNDVVLGLLFGYAQTTQYAIHGFWEFPVCKEYIDNNHYRTYGASTFWVIDKFLYKFGIGLDPKLPSKYNKRSGIWATFFLNWYMDFGYWGIPLMFFLGMFVKYIWNKIRYERNVFYLPLLLFFMLVFMYIMQLNRIVGKGTYALASFGIFAIWATRVMRTQVKNRLFRKV